MSNFWLKLKKPILALAPIAGVTDSAFRQICKDWGADVVYTEMVSADGLFHGSKKTLDFLKFSKTEKPVVIQLFGKNPEKFTKAASLCEKAGFSGVDINFGCPAKKVAGHGGGVTLMRDLPKCKEIIENVLKGTKLPVSVKLRSSINKNSTKVTALDFMKHMEGLPLSAVMIHGRSYEKPFDGEVDYGMIESVKKEFKGVVLGNGGIKTPQDAKRMMETGVDGVGLARGVYGNPWLFKEIKFFLKGKEFVLKEKDIKKTVLDHAKYVFESKGKYGLVELRKHLVWYASGKSGAKEMRSRLVRVENLSDVKEILKDF
ncbi:MAG: tRNA-dihydrouridine synthase [Patescibacteria group bacterium]